MKNAKLLLDIGNSMYNKSKNFIFFAPVGFVALFVTLFFCGEYASLYLVLGGPYAFVNFLVVGLYIIIMIGACAVWPYFMGLILIGIGQIAENTCKGETSEAVNSTTQTSVYTPKVVSNQSATQSSSNAKQGMSAKAIITEDGWICGNCQTKNSMNYGQCKKCGKFRG